MPQTRDWAFRTESGVVWAFQIRMLTEPKTEQETQQACVPCLLFCHWTVSFYTFPGPQYEAGMVGKQGEGTLLNSHDALVWESMTSCLLAPEVWELLIQSSSCFCTGRRQWEVFFFLFDMTMKENISPETEKNKWAGELTEKRWSKDQVSHTAKEMWFHILRHENCTLSFLCVCVWSFSCLSKCNWMLWS